MKRAAIVLVMLGSLITNSIAYADANDLRWIAKCLQDNANAEVATDVVVKYCTCMTKKMDKGETQSVTEWEKTHPAERAACDQESGWK